MLFKMTILPIEFIKIMENLKNMSKISKKRESGKIKPDKTFKILWVDPETHQLARILAAQQGVSIKEIVSLAVQNYTLPVN